MFNRPTDRPTVSEFLADLQKNEQDFSTLLDLASRDRPDLRSTYEIPQYLPLRVFKVSVTLYMALDLLCDRKLSRWDGDSALYDASGHNKAVINALSDFYRSTGDYEKHTRGLGNYTPIGQLLHLRKAVVKVEDTLKGKDRKEILQVKAAAVEAAVTQALALGKEAKKEETPGAPTPRP